MFKIYQIKEDSSNSNVNLSISRLKKLYDLIGNSYMSGFIGDSITSFSVDDNDLLEFTTLKELNNSTFGSSGVVLPGSIVFMQSVDEVDINNLISYDDKNNRFTFISFDDYNSMSECYNSIKNNNINLCSGDISSILNDIGVSLDSISKIYVKKDIKVLSSLIGDEYSMHKKSTFKR